MEKLLFVAALGMTILVSHANAQIANPGDSMAASTGVTYRLQPMDAER